MPAGIVLRLCCPTSGDHMAATPNLQRKLQQTLGPEAAADLGAWMQSMDAYRSDLSELQREMQAGFARIDERAARMEGRMDAMQASFVGRMDAMQARFDGRMDAMQASFDGRTDAMRASFDAVMERGLREQTRFFFLAWSVLLAAIIGLYARS